MGRGDVLKRHMKQHDKKEVMKVDKNSAKCEICMKTMRKNHLKRHMKKHENKNNEDKKGTLHKKVILIMQDFNRKKDMGRKLKEIMDNTANFNETALPKEMKEALDIFKLYGKSNKILKTNWRGWQQGLRENLKILENIKDGSAIAGKYQSCEVMFKTPNIVI